VAERAAKPRVTAADIAQAVGVSRATVGFVLNNTPGQTISAATRQRVLAEATRRGYRPNRAAQALARGRGGIALFVLPEWPADFGFGMHSYLDEAAQVLGEAGYSLVPYTRYPTDRARPLWETLAPDVVVGLFPFSDDEVAELRANGVTAIYPLSGPPPEDDPVVTSGTVLGVEYLAGLGHRRLAFAAPADQRLALIARPRALAAQRTAARLGLPLDVREISYRDGSAQDAARAWRAAGVTGVAAYSDETAAILVGGALRAGLSVPGDLAVIGHDDSPLSAMFVPSLSSVRVDYAGMGRQVARQVVHLARGATPPAADAALTASVVARESA
jgi:DNA-binding LacI/PurR family transcriptional regulator